MKIGIIGLQGSGKTTLFRALSLKEVSIIESNTASIKLPDKRLDFLSSSLHPKKTTYPDVEFIDAHGFGRESFIHFQNVDAFIYCIPYFGTYDNPIKCATSIKQELILRDLEICDTRIKKLEKEKATVETTTLEKCKEMLEKETYLSESLFSPQEEKILSPFQFMTLKPYISILNTDDIDRCRDGSLDLSENKTDRPEGLSLLVLNAKIEIEILELPEQERDEYKKELGMGKTPIEKFANSLHKELGVITFYTVKGDEAKAWQMSKGLINQTLTALDAAGKIHSDIQRGFIKAEVINFTDFEKVHSFKTAKEQGLIKLVSKDYIVQDGDIIEFKFNV